MMNFRLLTTYSRQQRKGIFALFIVMIILQSGYFILKSTDRTTSGEKTKEEKEWLALQSKIDELKSKKVERANTIYPFNPNFITDYKGYSLGMTVAQINRLHKFRKTGQYVNSAEDFKQVTGVHDTLLAKLAPYFKFPDWVKNKKQMPYKEQPHYAEHSAGPVRITKEEKKVVQLDINQALEEDLDKVYGIGPAFAKKILRRRDQLGAYVSMEQLAEFEEFSPEAVAGLKKQFKVVGQPQVSKLNVNTASLNQLSAFPYFNRLLGKSIITRRSMKGKLTGIEELVEINGFPVDKQKIIALYLDF